MISTSVLARLATAMTTGTEPRTECAAIQSQSAERLSSGVDRVARTVMDACPSLTARAALDKAPPPLPSSPRLDYGSSPEPPDDEARRAYPRRNTRCHSCPRPSRARLAGAMTAGLATGATAQMELKIMAPAAPGGGWDQTARSMQQALTASGSAKSVQVTNVTGAGGTVGLAQFVKAPRAIRNQLMVNGFVMVGAILTNKSPVSLDQTTPIARLTAEPQVIVVPADSPHQDGQGPRRGRQDRSGQGDLGGRLGRRRRPHRGGAVRQGRGRRSDEDQLHPLLGRRRGARRHPRRQGHGRHLGLWRVRGPGEGRQAARDRRHLAAARAGRSTPRRSRSRASTSRSSTGARSWRLRASRPTSARP